MVSAAGVSGRSVFRNHHVYSDFCLCYDWPERVPPFSAPAICQSRARQPKTLKMLKSKETGHVQSGLGEGAANKKTLIRLNLKCVVWAESRREKMGGLGAKRAGGRPGSEARPAAAVGQLSSGRILYPPPHELLTPATRRP